MYDGLVNHNIVAYTVQTCVQKWAVSLAILNAANSKQFVVSGSSTSYNYAVECV